MRIGLACLLLAFAGAVQGQSVHKCVGKGGAVSYQSQPCAATQKALKSWDATPAPPPGTDELWRHHYRLKQGEADSRYLSRLAGTDRPRAGGAYGPSPTPIDACAAAKARRESVLRQNNDDVGYDARRALNDMVYDACK